MFEQLMDFSELRISCWDFELLAAFSSKKITLQLMTQNKYIQYSGKPISDDSNLNVNRRKKNRNYEIRELQLNLNYITNVFFSPEIKDKNGDKFNKQPKLQMIT